MGPFTVQQVVNDVAHMLELPGTWRAHQVSHVSLLKPFVSNGEPMSPMPFNLIGGSENQFEVKKVDFGTTPPRPTEAGYPCACSPCVPVGVNKPLTLKP